MSESSDWRRFVRTPSPANISENEEIRGDASGAGLAFVPTNIRSGRQDVAGPATWEDIPRCLPPLRP
jgi:hypothetical protein